MADARRVGLRASINGLGRIIAGTIRTCLRYRVTGLAAEAGFFALLSLPPLILGLVAGLGYVGNRLGQDFVDDLKAQIAAAAGTVLIEPVVDSVILPTFDDVLQGGRLDVISLGFLLSLWSGSRVLNVYVDTVSIMYGLGGQRGIIRTRALSFSLYVLSLILGAVVFPLVLIGPELVGRALHSRVSGMPDLGWMQNLYWPVVVLLSVALLTTLYHVATPVRVPWRRDLPGAVLALLIWTISSAVLRVTVAASFGGSSIYGPLAAPIVVLIWLYLLAIAVLIGAALNATLDAIWPDPARAAAREDIGAHMAARPVTPITPVKPRPASSGAVSSSGPVSTGPKSSGHTSSGPVLPSPVKVIRPQNGATPAAADATTDPAPKASTTQTVPSDARADESPDRGK